ncbi:MAG: protein-methionine-sulfoxide reductase catalytic subunit MsrP [Alphaproteobacteria bacterium]|nr:protein-methionine-sulfoxide reductase catalytic subunit MsrP [Alphaproteobacteria bacterium]
MWVHRRPGWRLKESAATDESVYLNRRQLVAGIAAGSMLLPQAAQAQRVTDDPSAKLYPVKRNEKYKLDRPLTDEKEATTYNNFYEFGTSKSIVRAAQELKIRPWTLKIAGMVEKPFDIGIDDLLAKMPLEERLYRHRCVEAWAMAVPWSGFPLKALVDLAKPLGSAKYVVMTTFMDPSVAPGQKQFFYPWPYVEGLTVAEATNELAFIATGIYGKPMPKQNGSPLRLAVPWKYGFKSIKSIVKLEFSDKRPTSYWEAAQGSEYGFWANVHPAFPHPRWSQESERMLGTNERVPTQVFNGYGEFVGDLYKGLEKERLWA